MKKTGEKGRHRKKMGEKGKTGKEKCKSGWVNCSAFLHEGHSPQESLSVRF